MLDWVITSRDIVILSEAKDLRLKRYRTNKTRAHAIHSPKLDPISLRTYNRNFTVIHFFDLMNFSTGPAATRWAALFLAAPAPHSHEMRLE